MLATLVAAVALSACGAEPDPAQAPDPGEGVEDTTDDGDASGDQPEVAARDMSFDPTDIEVEVGTTVTFTNHDAVRHTVTSGDPGEPNGVFDEPIDDEGDTAMITFNEPGNFAYYCDLHRAMVGTVTVTG